MKIILLVSLLIIAACPKGDLNDDCRVDLRDFAILADNWLAEGTPEPAPDPMKIKQKKLQEAKKLLSQIENKKYLIVIVIDVNSGT